MRRLRLFVRALRSSLVALWSEICANAVRSANHRETMKLQPKTAQRAPLSCGGFAVGGQRKRGRETIRGTVLVPPKFVREGRANVGQLADFPGRIAML